MIHTARHKAVDRTPPREKGYGTRRCEAPGCDEATREGKPYCTEHVLMQPSVEAIITELAQRETEILATRRLGSHAVDVNGSVSQEILALLERLGGASYERIAKDTGVSLKAIPGYVWALHRAGLVRIGKTKRGNRMAELR